MLIALVASAHYRPVREAETVRVHADATGLALDERRVDARRLRRAGVPPDERFAIVEVDRERLVPPLRLRTRAAIALLPDDLEARTRVRIAATSTTLPELRLALERSAEDEETVAAALAAVDEATREAPLRRTRSR